MRAHWIIEHADNPGYFYNPDLPVAHRWFDSEIDAKRFPDADLALECIVRDLNGRGRAVEVIAPMVAAA